MHDLGGTQTKETSLYQYTFWANKRFYKFGKCAGIVAVLFRLSQMLPVFIVKQHVVVPKSASKQCSQ